MLSNLNEAVITQKTALKLFGNTDPINKTITFFVDGHNRNFLIKAVVSEFPSQSHIHFDVLFSLNSLSWTNNEQWLSTDFYTYILLHENIDLGDFQHRLNDYTSAMISPLIKDLSNSYEGSSNSFTHELQKLTDIHLHSDYTNEIEQNGDIVYLRLFRFVLLLLLIATITIFINLTKFRLKKAEQEIYVRKVFGAKAGSVFQRFIIEILLIVIASFFISYILLETIVPIIQKSIDISLFIYNRNIVLIAVAVYVFVAFVTGFATIPAFVRKISPFVRQRINTVKIRKFNFLLIIQMIVSVIVISGTLIIHNQIQFMENEKLGMEKDNIVIINGISKLNHKHDVFKNAILKNSNINSASYSYTIPGKQFTNIVCKKISGNSTESFVMSFCPCDSDFKEVFQLKLQSGNYFPINYAINNKSIVINEAAASLFSLSNPINQRIEFGGEQFKIIGVVNNFHFDTKRKEIQAMAMITMPTVYTHWRPKYLSVKVNNENLKSAIEFMQAQWNNFAPESTFRYSFFNTEYDKLYSKENKAKQLLLIFSILSLIIGSLGLISISLATIQRRTKEIGIRKVNGASVKDIVNSLNQQYIIMAVIALTIGFPIAHYLTSKWLQNFAYQVSFSIWIFLAVSVLMVFISIITISLQVYRAAIQNPINSLNDE